MTDRKDSNPRQIVLRLGVMSFSSILGHETIISGLKGTFERQRVSHAYLFSGPKGVGKARVAEAFIQLLSCTEPSEHLDPCGECRTCRLLAKGTHPDLRSLEPDGRFIKIDQIRELTRSLRYPPVEAKTRAVLIDGAEAMHEAAANALLKTLEEPSARTVFILITDQPNALLATIRSRCQQIRFTALSRDHVREWLSAEKNLTGDKADELAAMSGGSLRKAENLLDPEMTSLRQRWLDALSQLAHISPTQLLELANELSAAKAAIPSALDALRIGLRDSLLRSAGASEEQLTFRQTRADQLPILRTEDALTALELIHDSEIALRGNVNPRMVSEHLLMGLRRSIRASEENA